eukprot:7299821-Ditylum_brightwellii.AAC.1
MDVIGLLAAIRGCIFEFDDKKKKALAVYRAGEKFFHFKQTQEMLTPKYYKKFNNLVSMVKQFGGTIGQHPSIIDEWKVIAGKSSEGESNEEQEEEARELAGKEYLGIALLEKLCAHCFKKLKADLENHYT